MGLKDFFYNYNVLLPPLSPIFLTSETYFYFTGANIPAFHSDEINRLPLINPYSQIVIEFPRRLIISV